VNQFFEELGRRWGAAAHLREATIEAPSLDPRLRTAKPGLDEGAVAAYIQEEQQLFPLTTPCLDLQHC
jgi:hypothetical protein